MSDTIQNEKFVELNYKVIDEKTGDVLVTVDYPLGYVHGVNDVMSEQVTKHLDGKKVGDIIEIPVDTKLLYGERDESLVFTDRIENVPEEYREIGFIIPALPYIRHTIFSVVSFLCNGSKCMAGILGNGLSFFYHGSNTNHCFV